MTSFSGLEWFQYVTKSIMHILVRQKQQIAFSCETLWKPLPWR